ncbi:HEPN domain-containing protein [Candidatus Pacearchaeota archaeon]|nr:HEPN domain-containing protein [Candidatus Pacearchaeota archaeon]
MKKAEKEIKESEKQKKKVRHRCLLKIEPNMKLALGHLEKARHNLEVLKLLRENKSSDWSVAAGFYSLYHCFLAIAVKHGYESRNQTCTIALIESLQEEGKISINKEIIDFMKYEEEENTREDSLIELREDYTYGIDLEVKNEEQLDKIEKLCIEFIDIVKDIVYKNA